MKTKFTLWWVSGTKIRTRITIAAPATCHHTEMLLTTASRWLRKMFITAASTRITTKMMNTRVSE